MSGRGRSLNETITLKDGAGGRAMRTLIEEVFVKGASRADPTRNSGCNGADGVGLAAMDDGAAIRLGDRWLVVTTDSHVIHPIFFPGGDIGRLSVAGTVNDLAMMGATEVLALTCGVVLEEGFARADLERVQVSVRRTCEEAGAAKIDGLVLNTTGVALTDRVVPDCGLRPDDRILVTGSVGDHGFAILAARNGLDLEADLRSDVAPLNELIRRALAVGGTHVVAMKDPTRGGLASALHEMAGKSGVGILLDETQVPVDPSVQAASELLGIDPLHVANEGKAVLGVAPEAAEAVLDSLRGHPLGRRARIVGTCIAEYTGSVILETGFGRRLLTEPEGDPLPRIC
jgi:hydrogenase expression/formation protein HypE